MIKSICALARRSDVNRSDFEFYYETHHAPLACQHYPFRRYVRNHLVDRPHIGFDAISEFWSDDLSSLTLQANGPVEEIMDADERKFMDQSRICPGVVEETLLSAGAPADSQGERYAVLIHWSEREVEALKAAMAWGKSIASKSGGVSLDVVESGGAASFPARAVLWLPRSGSLFEPPSILSTRVLNVRRVETPRDRPLRG